MQRDSVLVDNVGDEDLCNVCGSSSIVVGAYTPSLDKRSIMTRIAVYPLNSGSCSMKSMRIKCHGRIMLSGRWRDGLFREHRTHCELLAAGSHRQPYVISPEELERPGIANMASSRIVLLRL